MLIGKFRPYLVAVVGVLLIVGPWLQSAQVRGSSRETNCSCCQGECKGCCCSMPTTAGKTKPADKEDGCSCQSSNLPAIPEALSESNAYRQNEKSIGAEIVSFRDAVLRGSPSLYDLAPGKSPPLVSSRPAYVLFSALLI